MGYKPVSRVDGLLHELCVGRGFCLPPDDWAAIVADPPGDAESFVDVVLVAEGIDPRTYDKRNRRRLVDLVDRWLSAPNDPDPDDDHRG